MKSINIKQFAFSLVALLSLFVSGVSACACSHHHNQAEIKNSSCREHPAHQENNSNDQVKLVISETGCACVQAAPKFAAKSEFSKFEKQVTVISLETPVKISAVSQIILDEIRFIKPFYLSDSFYNFSHGRAPPRL